MALSVEMKPKTKIIIDEDELHSTHYRTNRRQFESLARRAFDAGHNSIKRIIDEGAFKRTWQTDLEERRQNHHKLGLKDHQFWPAVVRRKLGYEVPMGRPKKPKPTRKA